ALAEHLVRDVDTVRGSRVMGLRDRRHRPIVAPVPKGAQTRPEDQAYILAAASSASFCARVAWRTAYSASSTALIAKSTAAFDSALARSASSCVMSASCPAWMASMLSRTVATCFAQS